MDLKSMQATFWMLLFGFLIFVPGSTLNTIENTATERTAAVSEEAVSIARTIPRAAATATDEPSKTPSLFKDAINDKTFLKTQSTTLTAATLSSAEVPPVVVEVEATTTTTKTTITTSTTSTERSSLARKATNVSISIATKASLNPSANAKDTTTKTTTTITSSREAVKSTTEATATTTTTKEQVTKAELLVGRLKPITAKSLQTPNNGDSRFINNNNNNSSNNNNSDIYNNGVSVGVANTSEQNGNIAFSDNNTQNFTKQQQQQQQQQQTRPLQRPNIYNDNRREQKYQQQHLYKQHQLQQRQQQETQLRQQFTRHVQRADAAATATTTTTLSTTTYANNVTTITVAAVDSNIIIADKNIKENELETDNADESNLKATVAISFETSAQDSTTTSSILSASSAIATPATQPPPAPASTTTIKTTTRRPVPTTTLKPPPAIDDYRTITSQAGTHAYLPCNVKQLVKKPISWLRVRDGHILTVDQTTFIADQRFQSIYTPNPERWSLQIKYVQLKDAGTYECQVSTEPKASAIISLRIVEPKTELIGESSRHVKAGSQVKLRCIISQALEPPLFINWFYNQKQIYLHNRKGWRTEIERIDLPPETTAATTTTTRSGTTAPATMAAAATAAAAAMAATVRDATSIPVAAVVSDATALVSATTMLPAIAIATMKTTTTTTTLATTSTTTMAAAPAEVKQITTASLIIPSVEKLDSGNYTCSPSNSAPRTVVLHVLNGEYSASAITSGASGKQPQSNLMLTMLLTTMTMMIFVGNKRTKSQQGYFDWQHRAVATFLTLLWTIKLLYAKYIWNFSRDRNKIRQSEDVDNSRTTTKIEFVRSESSSSNSSHKGKRSSSSSRNTSNSTMEIT